MADRYVVTCDYQAEEPAEVSLAKGELVVVHVRDGESLAFIILARILYVLPQGLQLTPPSHRRLVVRRH